MRCGFACAVAVAIALSGCASSGGFPDNPVDASTDLEPLKAYFAYGDATKIKTYMDMPVDNPIGVIGKRAALRNEIAYGRIAAYDIEFAKFQQAINRERT